MVENVYTLLSTDDLDIKLFTQLFNNSLSILWFHQQFNIIEKFITKTCLFA